MISSAAPTAKQATELSPCLTSLRSNLWARLHRDTGIEELGIGIDPVSGARQGVCAHSCALGPRAPRRRCRSPTAATEAAAERSSDGRWTVRVLVLGQNIGRRRAITAGLCFVHETLPSRAGLVMDADGEDRPEVRSRCWICARSSGRHRVRRTAKAPSRARSFAPAMHSIEVCTGCSPVSRSAWATSVSCRRQRSDVSSACLK